MKILITGGAGFIGSNICEKLLSDERIKLVRVLDNFATGKLENIDKFNSSDRFELIEGDIRNYEDCLKATDGINAVSHQAALGSVPRSINDPQTSHDVNLNGFVNVLEAARANGIRRIVYASSSSVYGDLPDSPKVENRLGKVLSPYAATKMANEVYAQAWSKSYGMQLFGFRYFNVFGPNQDPNGAYAAVVPLFIKSALNNESPTINGDGTITRDFTPISNVVQVNINGMLFESDENFHEVINVACGNTTSLLDLWKLIKDLSNSNVDPVHVNVRPGDILQSLANIEKAQSLLGYQPEVDLKSALLKTMDWMKSK